MIVKQARFVTSLSKIEQYPGAAAQLGGLPEICVVGRSNVGKSSFINFLTGRRALAKTSQTPGRTRLINLFSINDDAFLLVDLPGYGYAKAPRADKSEWDRLIGGYLENSRSLRRVLLLVDCRHEPSALDVSMAQYLYFYRLPFTVIATKTDKLSKAQLGRSVQALANGLKLGRDDILPTSAKDGQGREKVLAHLAEILTRDYA
ncbi:MAG: ribosome biogenesis GTP-binding protein YihA/YsxC [Clostridiales bacterium]|jgi:GTP-binding protein|nr:ribosome biogenesis GTP-binding protein YihA/YsxC [Clostridiales bacterium]